MNNDQILSKSQAIEAMERGEKVTHRYFQPDEYIYLKDGEIYSEDGVCQGKNFWHFHRDMVWITDWKIYKEIKK